MIGPFLEKFSKKRFFFAKGRCSVVWFGWRNAGDRHCPSIDGLTAYFKPPSTSRKGTPGDGCYHWLQLKRVPLALWFAIATSAASIISTARTIRAADRDPSADAGRAKSVSPRMRRRNRR